MAYEIPEEETWNEAALVSAEELRATFADALSKPDLIELIVFEDDGVIVGFANLMITYSVWSQGLALILDDLYVGEVHRGKGYGRKALECTEEIAKERECKRLSFYSRDSNPHSKDFYIAMGYSPVDMKYYAKYL